MKEVEDIQNSVTTTEERKDQYNIMFKSAFRDHAVHKTHTIDWQNVSIKDGDNNSTRRIKKESVCINNVLPFFALN